MVVFPIRGLVRVRCARLRQGLDRRVCKGRVTTLPLYRIWPVIKWGSWAQLCVHRRLAN